MKQIKITQPSIDWEEKMNETIEVEITIGELINLTMLFGTGYNGKAIQEARETFSADEVFYNTIPYYANLYTECINIILNNLPIQLKHQREISYELD